MSFETAKELERRAADRVEAEADRKLTRDAVDASRNWFLLTIATLLVSAAITVVISLCGD